MRNLSNKELNIGNWEYVDKKRRLQMIGVVSCTPAGARTLDTLIKSQVLYQLSYKRMPDFRIAGAKVRTFFETAKCFPVFFLKKRHFFYFTLFYIYN